MLSRTILLGSFIALLAVPAMAQGNNAINVIGTVDKVDATSISVKNDDGGQTQTFKLAPNVLYIQQSPAKLSDIKNNDFVASAAVRKEDGDLKRALDAYLTDVRRSAVWSRLVVKYFGDEALHVLGRERP